MTFNDMGLKAVYCNKLADNGITKPTRIQAESMPRILKGEDLIAQSMTGTGKTVAYLLPLLQSIESRGTSAMIIAPTKELASQIHSEAVKYKTSDTVTLHLLTGGTPVERQQHLLEQSESNLIIGVPGRINTLIESGAIKPAKVRIMVLDEADFLIDLGFVSEIEKFISQCRHCDQILIFAATLSEKTKEKLDLIHNQKFATRVHANALPDSITNWFIPVEDSKREETLYNLLDVINPYLAIIFVRTKKDCQDLYNKLKARGINTGNLHGSLAPSQRKKQIQSFKKAKTQYLVATDLASRGLDIESVTHIINYHLPVSQNDYVHRAGRTGRMEQSGDIISLCNELDEGYLKKYAFYLDVELKAARLRDGRLQHETGYEGVKPRFNLDDLKKKKHVIKKKTKTVSHSKNFKGKKHGKKKK
jgi:superfamily II DNA/RNA helicase